MYWERQVRSENSKVSSLTCPQIVKPEDATTNCSGKTCINIPYDHRRIAKIESKSEEEYEKLITFIKNLSQSQNPTPEPPEVAENLSAGVDDSVSQLQTPSESQVGTSLHEPRQYFWPRKTLKWFYNYLHKEIINQSVHWEILEENFEDNINSSAPFQERCKKFSSETFSFCYPEHKSTIVILTVPSRKREFEANWTIMSSDSNYHPGKHHGSIELPSDFPWKPPHIRWESPLLSAYVSSRGKVCLYDDFWSPMGGFYRLLESLASIVIFGPALNLPHSTPLPALIPGRFSRVQNILIRQKHNENEDWMVRVTNLFSRAYNRMDDEEDPEMPDSGTDGLDGSVSVTEFDKKTSITAIEDMEEHFTYSIDVGQADLVDRGKYIEKLRSQGLVDAREDFKLVTTQRQLLKFERTWVDGINAALGNVAFHTPGGE